MVMPLLSKTRFQSGRQCLRRLWLEYCKRDTWATVRIWQELCRFAEAKGEVDGDWHVRQRARPW